MSKPPGHIIYRDQLITTKDLDNFKNELLAAFRTMLFNSRQETATAVPAKRWLKSYEVKRILKISTGTLQHLRNSKELPFSKLGGTMYYDAEVIAQLLAAREQNASVPLAFQKHSIKSNKERRA